MPNVTDYGTVSYVEKPRAHAGKPTMTTSIPSSVTTLEGSQRNYNLLSSLSALTSPVSTQRPNTL